MPGLRRGKVYKAWQHMLSRCHDPRAHDFGRYGARGIRVAKEWHDFDRFYRDVGVPPSPKHTLGRIDNSKGYCPGNVRWETWEQNNRNRRDTRMVTCAGKTLCLMEWSERTGIPYKVLSRRLYELGWPPDKAFTTPARGWRRAPAEQIQLPI